MKHEFAFLYPPPRAIRFGGPDLDIDSVCFPLEMVKKYGFLFEHFSIRARSRGLQVVFQEQRDMAGDEYAVACEPGRVVLRFRHARGQFYALSTLLQILSFHGIRGRMPAFSLRDAPQTALRGFLLRGAAGAVPTWRELRALLLKLALLKFSHLALPAAVLAREVESLQDRDDAKSFSAMARGAGVEIIWHDEDDRALLPVGAVPAAGGAPFARPAIPAAGAGEDGTRPDAWLGFFLARHLQAKRDGAQVAVWSDVFLRRPEWIRKIPQDVLVLHRGEVSARPDLFKAEIQPFKKHHLRLVLSPSLCGRDRFIPDARAAMDRVGAAAAVVRAGKLAGILLASGERGSGGCLPEGAGMLLFLAGCLLWSGRKPGPAAFSLWALGRDEPDLFRIYSFLAQAEHRLPHSHCRYLFEDPLFAPFSRQGDPREIEAHFHKAAIYLEKREISGIELAGFLAFCRRLYEFIAVKVRLSASLGSLLREENGGAEVSRLAAGLEQGAEDLKNHYVELWSRHVQPGGLPCLLDDFARLQGRLAYLRRAGAKPAARESLLAELQSDSPADEQR